MAIESLAAALEREHHEIDEGIETFAAALRTGESRPEPLTRAMDALRRHIYLEEELLFPALREAGLTAPVFVMLREHGKIWHTMDALEQQLGKGGSSPTLLKTCHDLVVQLQHHNLKEERILHPRADTVPSPAANATLSAFLESGRPPEDWVCERART